MSPLRIESIEDAVEALSFAGLTTFALSARRAEGVDFSPPDDANLTFQLGAKVSERGVGYRCRATAYLDEVELVVDMAADFTAEDDVKLESAVVRDFGDNVAIMTLYPYIRQAASDLGSRLGFETTFPLLKRGDIRFGEQGSPGPIADSARTGNKK